MSLKIERAIRSYVFRAVEQACEQLGRKPWVLQIGANDGLTDDPVHALITQRGWRGALVEPIPSVFHRLKENYAGIDNLRFVQAAIGERDGQATFFIGENTRKASLIEQRAAAAGKAQATEVRLMSAATLLKEADLPSLDVLVTDTEGADAAVLRQFDFSQVRPMAVIYETHLLDADDRAELAQRFKEHGYMVLQMYADSFAIRGDQMSEPLAKLLQFAHNEYVALSREAKKAAAEVSSSPSPPVPVAQVTSATTEPSSLGAEGADNDLVNWYFAVNGPGLQKGFELVKTAVISARLNTTLKPNCIYDGRDCDELAWLVKNEVHIIRHSPTLEPELRVGYGKKYDQFNGHWLRADLPIIDRDSVQALYTDIDVMFLRDPRKYIFRPEYMAVCEEHEVGMRSHFNSGSMVLNLEALRKVHPWFMSSIKRRLLGRDFSFPPHDQRSFNDFFLEKADWMRPEFNWKPYWGYNEDAVIVHFHGPKPAHVRKIRAGNGSEMKAAYVTIYNRNPQGYERYIETFERFLEQS